MNSHINIRNATINDISFIVDIIRNANKDKLDKIVYGQKGIYKYIESRILDKNLNTIYRVAELGNKIVGAMELRVHEKALFLNYIAVKSDMKSLGIGKAMMKNLINEKKYKYLLLDVFKDNKIAYKWYSNIGFKIENCSYWLEITGSLNEKINIYSDNDIYTDLYYLNGFDIVKVILQNKKYNVGIMGSHWFRLYEDEVDENIIRYLKQIENRRILYIVRYDKKLEIGNFESKKIKTSYRMRAKIEDIKNYMI